MKALIGVRGSGWEALVAPRAQGAQALAELCGLEDASQVESCGRTDCAFLDRERGTCGLLAWNAPRLGREALRWFVARRFATEIPADDTGALEARAVTL